MLRASAFHVLFAAVICAHIPFFITCAAKHVGIGGSGSNGSGCGSGSSGRRALSVACSAAPGFGAAGASEGTGPRVCILGGGFGGLYTAVKLESLIWPRGTKPRVSWGELSGKVGCLVAHYRFCSHAVRLACWMLNGPPVLHRRLTAPRSP